MDEAAQPELEGQQIARWRALADKHWLRTNTTPSKVKTDVIKNEIWDVLERDSFECSSLIALEGLQLLER